MQRRTLLTSFAAAAGVAAMLSFAPAHAQWKPNKPINLIVPWAAGGSTDQVTRITAAEIEKVLGQKIVVVNQPGASGSIGTKNAWEAPKDGYTWTAGAAQDLGAYQSLGMLDVSIKDWHLFLNVANIAVVGVGAATRHLRPPTRDTAARRDEGQAGPDQGGDGRRDLRGPQRHGSDCAGHRRHLPSRDL